MSKQYHTLPTIAVNPETELKAILEFVRATWDIPAELSEESFVFIITNAFNTGLEAGANWYDNTDFSLEWHDQLWEKRNDFLDREENKDLYFHDGWKYVISCVSRGHDALKRQGKGKFRYETFMGPILRVARKVEGALKLSPKGYGQYEGKSYQEIRDAFEDHADLGYWDDAYKGDMTRSEYEEDTFKGHTFETCGSFPMVGRMALHYVLQSDVNQGRGPMQELLSAIATQGLNVAEWNNIAGATEIIPTLAEQMTDEFAQEVPELPDNEFIKKCFAKGEESEGPFRPLTPELQAEYTAKQAEWDALTDEEKAERKAKTDRFAAAQIERLLKNLD